MAVTKDVTRKAVNIAWNTDALSGDLSLTASNADDVSVRLGLDNDGFAVVTYPADYHGTSHIVLEDSNGATEEGDITV